MPYLPGDNELKANKETISTHFGYEKPLSEPMMVCFTDAYMRHSVSMS